MSVPDLLAADPNTWRDQARAWTRLADDLDDRAGDLRRHGDRLRAVWEGRDADAALAHGDRLVAAWRRRADDLTAAGLVVADHADRIDTARRRAFAVHDAAAPTHTVGDDGAVVLNPWGAAQAALSPLQAVALTQRGVELTAELAEILDQAGIDDDRSAARLRALAVVNVPPAPAGTGSALPLAGAPSAEVARWWGALPAEQREQLYSTDPAAIGALDGVPVLDRDRANRIVLDAAHEQVANERDSLLARPGDGDRTAALARVDEKAHALDVIEQRLNGPGAPAYLLGLDTAASGRAIVAVGDPDTADNVITYVPGTGARLGGTPGDIVRADAMVESAHRADPSASTAAIAWVGYDAPQVIAGVPPGETDAINPGYAERAGPQLDRFQDGLRATHHGDPSHNTVLGHSYGSTVVGHGARQHDLDADDLVFVGSPGVGADHVTALNHDPDRVWSTHIGNDPIKVGVSPEQLNPFNPDDSPDAVDLIHGANPSHPGFGAEAFGSQQGSLGTGAHSEYWDENSESLRNIGAIATGRYERVTR